MENWSYGSGHSLTWDGGEWSSSRPSRRKKEALLFKSQFRHSSPESHIRKLRANCFSPYYKIHQFGVVSFSFHFFSSQLYQAVLIGFIIQKRSASNTHDKCLSHELSSMRRHSAKNIGSSSVEQAIRIKKTVIINKHFLN